MCFKLYIGQINKVYSKSFYRPGMRRDQPMGDGLREAHGRTTSVDRFRGSHREVQLSQAYALLKEYEGADGKRKVCDSVRVQNRTIFRLF